MMSMAPAPKPLPRSLKIIASDTSPEQYQALGFGHPLHENLLDWVLATLRPLPVTRRIERLRKIIERAHSRNRSVAIVRAGNGLGCQPSRSRAGVSSTTRSILWDDVSMTGPNILHFRPELR